VSLSAKVLPALGHSPLIFALAQVRMSPVAKIEDFLPGVQDLVRRGGYADLAKRRIQFSQFAGPNKVEDRTIEQWECINSARTTSLLFDERSMSVQTTAYDRFESFLAQLRIGLDALGKVVQPAQVQRIGFRCVNLILPERGSFDYYVRRELLGARLDGIGERKHHLTESIFETSRTSRLIVRYQEAQSGIGLPMDLVAPISLGFKVDLKRTTPFALLDLDHFWEESHAFDVDRILKNLYDLHRGLDDVFLALVTDGALAAWQ
jgi:uncharacterized protein (TIGR04255 family)